MQSDDAYTISLYQKLVAKHGINYRSLDWGSVGSQQTRFSVLSEIGPLNKRKILDVGCGLADFYDWLLKRNISCDYSGIDITPDMIECAINRFPSLDLHVSSLQDYHALDHSFDYVFASGEKALS